MKSKLSGRHGNAPFTLDASHIQTARDAGLLRPETIQVRSDRSDTDFGVAYDRQDNIGTDVFDSQKAIQSRCKRFALQCGFQLFVKHSSPKPNNSGNAKYNCKLLNGQQFYDSETTSANIECPFYLNVYGVNGKWKLTKANFCHNHIMHVGPTQRPRAEVAIVQSVKDMRNTTQQTKQITALVELKMLPAHNGSIATMTRNAIRTFLQAEGFEVSHSAISRIKHSIDDKLHGDRLESYQKLESYFTIMCDKNTGSVWRFDKELDGFTFKRACFFPNAGIYAAHMAKLLYGFDGAHLKGEMHQRDVYLVATAKDYNNHIIPFGFAIVPVENYENWHWFLQVAKEALGGLKEFMIVSDRQKGLLSAVAEVFPSAGHRFCLRHIMNNINRLGCSLTVNERRLICSMARSDCESDLKFFTSEMKKIKADAVVYLELINLKHWVKYKFQEEFKIATYGEITSNLSEQANNWMGTELRSAKPLHALHLYFLKLSELLSEKRQVAASMIAKRVITRLVDVLEDKLKGLTEASKKCKFIPCMEGGYSVQYLGPVLPSGYEHPWRFVDLPAQECTCGNWQDTKFPCVHAVCAAIADGMPLGSLYDSSRLSVAHFRDTCNHPFRPWPTDVTLKVGKSLRLPVVAVSSPEKGKRGLKPGPKPKHKRKKSKGET